MVRNLPWPLTSDAIISNQISATLAVAIEVGHAERSVANVKERKVFRDTPNSYSTYRCVLAVYSYWQNVEESQHLNVQTCLEHAILEEPNYSEANAALAFIYLDEHRYG